MQYLRAVSVIVALTTAGAAALSGQTPPPAAELSARIQTRYATIRDFTADFTLTQTSGLTRQNATDKGKVAVKKPDRMRWTLDTGSRHEVVSDGADLYSYLPKDKLVQITRLPKNDQASTALLLLTGRGDLTRDFVPTPEVGVVPGEWRLTVTPKRKQSDFTTMTLAVDRSTLRLLGLTLVDDQGGVKAYRFSNLKENQGLADALFTFKIPRGVELQR